MKYLLDTNVISETQRPRPDPRVTAWLASADDNSLYLSVVTIREIIQGIEKIRPRDSAKALACEAWLAGLMADFSNRIVPIDIPIAEHWGRLNGRCLAAGRCPPFADHLLAATAAVRGMTLVTRNVTDFRDAGILIETPWDHPGQGETP